LVDGNSLPIGAMLRGAYELLVSSGAQRATQTLATFACASAQPVPGGTIVEPSLRSRVEDRWRDAYRAAGSGELGARRSADPELVHEGSAILGSALQRVLDRLSENGRALVVGRSPTNEAAVPGLTGEIIVPMGKGAGVVGVLENGQTRVRPLP
jgi:hypothetical protein